MGMLEQAGKTMILGATLGGILAVVFYVIGQGTSIDLKTYSETTPFLGLFVIIVLGMWFESKRISAGSKGLDYDFYMFIVIMYTIAFLVFGNFAVVGVANVTVWLAIGAAIILIPGHYAEGFLVAMWFCGLFLSGFRGDFYEVALIYPNSGAWYIVLGFRDLAKAILDPLFGSLMIHFL